MMNLSQAAKAVSGSLRGTDARFDSVCTDSRAITRGSLFVALKGERYDGHAFVPQARASGAVGAMVDSSEADALTAAQPLVAVDDSRASLGRLAAHWRGRFDIPLIGVVGSNGKTTVKEMTAAILRDALGDSGTLATAGNLNNDIGLPITLLRLANDHRAAVIEIGMNHRGETALLAAIAKPTIGIINNAQREHQEFMRSVREVAEEHAALADALPPGGCLVLNADDAFASLWREHAACAGAQVRDFAVDAQAAVRASCRLEAFASDIALRSPEGETRFTLPLPGVHNVRNALAAAAAATAAGAGLESVARALSSFSGVRGRAQRATSRAGAVVIDDSYNANPESVRAAIDVLAALPAPTVLVLGDMGEVGAQGAEFHREIGIYAKASGISVLYGLGELMRHAVDAFGSGSVHAGSFDDLLVLVMRKDRRGTTLLVKGSRFMRMERVVSALVGNSSPEAH